MSANDVEILDAKKVELQEEIALLEKHRDSAHREFNEMQREIDNLVPHAEKARLNLSSITDEIQDIDSKRSLILGEISTLQSQKISLESDISTLQNDMLSNVSAQNDALKSMTEEFERVKTEQESTLSTLKAEVIDNSNQLESQRHMLEGVKNSEAETKERIAVLDSGISEKESRVEYLDQKITMREGTIAKLKEGISDLETKKEELLAEKKIVVSDIGNATFELEKVRTETVALVESASKIEEREKALKIKESELMQKFDKAGVPYQS